jgi:monoamine oxidase
MTILVDSPAERLVELDGYSRASAGESVVVIGAGVAGLVAARKLERLGHQVTVLERRQRIGGRLYTHAFTSHEDGPAVELGAMRIAANHARTLQLIKELDLAGKLRPFRTLFSDDAAYIKTRYGHARVRDASPALVEEIRSQLPDRPYPADAVLFTAWLTACIKAVAPGEFRHDLPDTVVQELLEYVQGIDLRPYLTPAGGVGVDLNAFFADHGSATRYAGQLHRFFDDVAVETSSRLYRLERGMSQITSRLAASLRGPLLLGREVTGIRANDNGVTLQVRRKNETVDIDCDAVICTIPFSVMRTMKLVGLDPAKMRVIRDIAYWPATKIALHCREPFWLDTGIAEGASFSGGLARQTYYPAVEGDPALGAALLASYTIGSDAQILDQMSPDRRIELLLKELHAMHPELSRPGMVRGTITQSWGLDPSSLGGAVSRWGKDLRACREEQELASRPQGSLFFAGEHCSSHPAWIEGAVESADEVVAQMVRAGFRCRVRPVSRSRS